MTDFSTAKGLDTIQYAASIAATWVWAPAIFVASGVACQYGLEGLMWFLVPNVLTLVLFGCVAEKADAKGPTASDVITADKNQRLLHKVISILLLVCSTFVQLLGVYYLASEWFNCSRLLCGAIVLGFALSMIWRGGLRACILTDFAKYAIMVLVGATLLFSQPDSELYFPEYSSLDLALSFGIPTAIGLFAAPYVDSTFWQRAYSIERGDRLKVFISAAALFALVPLIFGTIGLGQPQGWTIQGAFDTGAGKVFLGLAVLSALVSTIDSNLCAVGAYFKTKFAVVTFSLLTLLAFVRLDSLTIVDMFLFYGTLRTVAAVPTILTVYGKADSKRLFRATLTAALLCPTGFALCKVLGVSDWACIFTVLAVLIPLIGLKR